MDRPLWKILNTALVLTFLGLNLQSYERPATLAFWVVVLVGAVTALNFFALRLVSRAGENKYWLLLLPSLYLLGLAGILAAISLEAVKILVALLALGLFFLRQLSFPHRPPVFVEELFPLAAGFVLLVSIWAGNFFFTPPWWAISLLTFFLFILVFRQIFFELNFPPRAAWIWSLVSTLILVEVAWATLFWPVYFLNAAVVNFAVFYLLAVLTKLHFAGRLTSKKVYFQTAIILLVVLTSLLSSPWRL